MKMTLKEAEHAIAEVIKNTNWDEIPEDATMFQYTIEAKSELIRAQKKLKRAHKRQSDPTAITHIS